MILRCRSGEEIRKGDGVLFHRNPAEIEFVASDANDLEADWYVQEFGGGLMMRDPHLSGRTFVPANQSPAYEDLEFISRTG